jgi:hypothetical protein
MRLGSIAPPQDQSYFAAAASQDARDGANSFTESTWASSAPVATPRREEQGSGGNGQVTAAAPRKTECPSQPEEAHCRRFRHFTARRHTACLGAEINNLDARGLMAPPKCTLLDEATLGLAPVSVDEISETYQTACAVKPSHPARGAECRHGAECCGAGLCIGLRPRCCRRNTAVIARYARYSAGLLRDDTGVASTCVGQLAPVLCIRRRRFICVRGRDHFKR